MVHSFVFPQETIASIQQQLEKLQGCLNNPNPQDEVMAEILELANSRKISLSQLREEFKEFQHNLNRFTKLREQLNEKIKQGELAVLLCVKCNFILKEIAGEYWYFFLNKDGKETFKIMAKDFINIYQTLKIASGYEGDENEDTYIILQSLKHLIQSLVQASLRVNALSEEEVSGLDLGDITPQESETMLTSLASTKKWDWVYKNLA
ncbi:hypothetical protein [Calothrix sp. PCC 7507]|uniref:hypothetical protein n=1 Tax=Calothrix sp. PCC 7507 TaxID=99598 RepID=UPI00029F0DDD|nr:hypothetical protein [Calothrix sp. PCC 7507]AFY31340.1 hypothetical protein Cal7507_0856 [Calothrix sp. PCC 7507]